MSSYATLSLGGAAPAPVVVLVAVRPTRPPVIGAADGQQYEASTPTS
jgi:hypothetical protein